MGKIDDKSFPMPGIPFQSKLEPFYDFIRECRANRWSYVRIAQAITRDHGMKVCPGTVFSFVKVRAKNRTLYALPPKRNLGLAVSGQGKIPPVTKDVVQLASDFFRPAGQPSNSEPIRTKNEKRPYRIDS
jgi:hypothetical protein